VFTVQHVAGRTGGADFHHEVVQELHQPPVVHLQTSVVPETDGRTVRGSAERTLKPA